MASLVLPGCFGIAGEERVAATVNGEGVLESEVTDYIEGFRSQNPEYESDAGWAEFLRGNGYTAESIRRLVLDTVLIPKVIIHQQCAARGVTLVDSELDAVIEKERLYYEGRYGANSWDSVLSSYGYDEESWRENEADRLLEEQLADEVVGTVEPTRAQVQAEADEGGTVYNGKHSHYLSFASEHAANVALSRLRSHDGELTVRAFEAAGGSAADAGWNCIPADRDAMGTEYVTALNGLSEGEYSGAVQQGQEWVIVFCDEVFTIERSQGHVDLDRMPAEIRAQVEADAHDSLADEAFSKWMADVFEQASISYTELPDGLPYDVNVAVGKGEDG